MGNRVSRTDTYIFKQLLLALVAVTLGLAALVWLTQSLRFIELVLDRGLSLLVFLELTGLMLPNFFAVILPITTFVVTLFVYVRLASDRELVVMRAAGLSQWVLARPAVALAALTAVLVLWLQLYLVPVSHAAFRAWQFEIRNQMAGLLLQEGVFSQVGNDLTVYARERERDGTLRGILVQDSREAGAPVTILAESGRIIQTPNGPRVTLVNGQRQQIERLGNPPVARLSVLSFAENSVDLARATRSDEVRSRDSRERSIGELLNPDPAERLRDRELRRFRAEGHQRLSAPLTVLSFALVALAVALTGEFRRHGGGARLVIGVAIAVALLALGLTTGTLAARDNGWVPLIWVHAAVPGILAALWISDQVQAFVRRRSLPAPTSSAAR